MLIPWMTVDLFDPRGAGGWRVDYRPYPEDDPRLSFGGWVDRYEPGKYDLVIFHIDNWSTGSGKDALRLASFRYLESAISDDVPQVVICHGRPNNARNREEVLQVIGDRWLVCNSHKAQEEWGVEKSIAIWHGYDVDEWPRAPFVYNPYALTVCSGGQLSRMYHGINIIERLQKQFPDRFYWCGERGDFKCASFNEYRHWLSEAYVYVHTTQWAPHSGSRTEAQLCGVPVVTTCNDDEHLFLRDGENAFVTNDYLVMRERIAQLLEDRELARKMGEAGRETARELFSVDAYAERWRAFLEEKLGLEVRE